MGLKNLINAWLRQEKEIPQEISQKKAFGEWTEADREKAKAAKTAKALELQRLQGLNEHLEHLKKLQEEKLIKDRIARIEDELYPDDEGDDDDDDDGESIENTVIKSAVKSMFGGRSQAQAQAQPAQMPGVIYAGPEFEEEVPGLDEESCRVIVKKLPGAVKGQIKGLDNASLERIIQLIKSER